MTMPETREYIIFYIEKEVLQRISNACVYKVISAGPPFIVPRQLQKRVCL